MSNTAPQPENSSTVYKYQSKSAGSTLNTHKRRKQAAGSGGRILRRLIICLILLAIGVVFFFYNTHSVIISFVYAELNAPLYVVMLCSMGVGIIATVFVGWLRRKNKAREKDQWFTL